MRRQNHPPPSYFNTKLTGSRRSSRGDDNDHNDQEGPRKGPKRNVSPRQPALLVRNSSKTQNSSSAVKSPSPKRTAVLSPARKSASPSPKKGLTKAALAKANSSTKKPIRGRNVENSSSSDEEESESLSSRKKLTRSAAKKKPSPKSITKKKIASQLESDDEEEEDSPKNKRNTKKQEKKVFQYIDDDEDDEDDENDLLRPSFSQDLFDDTTSTILDSGTFQPRNNNNNNQNCDGDDDDDGTRSFQSLSISRIPAETHTHGYIFLDYENINFHPKQISLFLSALEAVLKSQLRDHKMTFSVVACAPYFCFQDDKVLIHHKIRGDVYPVSKRLAGIALEVLNNANVDCKVVPTNKREQADKKIIMDKMMAAINPNSGHHHHHFVVVSSDAGFGASLRQILNIPAWSSKVSATIIHNLPLTNVHLYDLETAVGGSKHLMSVGELMDKAAKILLKPPPAHHKLTPAQKQMKKDRAAMMLEVEPLQYGVLWKPMKFDNEVLVNSKNEHNNNGDRCYQNQNFQQQQQQQKFNNNTHIHHQDHFNSNNNNYGMGNESPRCKYCGNTSHFSRNCKSKPERW